MSISEAACVDDLSCLISSYFYDLFSDIQMYTPVTR